MSKRYPTPAERKAEIEAERYAKAVAADALARQEAAKVTRHGCCWEPIGGPHHPVCEHAEDPDAPPPLIEGQESFA